MTTVSVFSPDLSGSAMDEKFSAFSPALLSRPIEEETDDHLLIRSLELILQAQVAHWGVFKFCVRAWCLAPPDSVVSNKGLVIAFAYLAVDQMGNLPGLNPLDIDR